MQKPPEWMIKQAAQPFIRPGATDFDMRYALEILDARDRLTLAALIEANPGKVVTLFSENMGFVPHKK